MVLEAKVASDIAAAGLAFVDIDELVIEDNRDLVACGNDLISVPLTDLHVRVNGRLDVINGSGLVFMRLVAADLNLVSLFHGNPGIISGIGETDENSRVVGIFGSHELDGEARVGKLFFAIPPKAHASFCGGNAVFEFEGTRARHLPVGSGFGENTLGLFGA